ncbi:uncharacterized protein ACIBXB_005925 [Morphnus guianensis]
MPAGSKLDLPLTKANPISDGGSTSGITYLRRETCSGGGDWNVRETPMQIPRSVKKEGEEVMPLQPVVRWQAVPLQPMEVNDGAEVPEDGRDSMGKPALEQFVTEDQPVERTHAREVREELKPVERTHAREVCEELQPTERTHVGEVCEGQSPVGGTPRWSRGRVRSPPPEEEGAAETMCGELTPTPIPCSPAPPGGGGRENWEWS